MPISLFDVKRLEAFSDGVLAIIITIMVIAFVPPRGGGFSDLAESVPMFLAYTLSFVYIAIYWNNHHHLLKAARGINASIMWSNMLLLFCLSLIPFVTSWMSKFHYESAPTASYAIVLLAAAIGYTLLQRSIIVTLDRDSAFVKSIGRDIKGLLSALLYAIAILCAFWNTVFSQVLFVVVALMWIVPDKRIERAIG